MNLTSILCEVIVGIFSLAGIILTNMASNRKIEQNMQTSQAVTDTKLENLTEEVRKHNNFAQKIPVLEEKVKYLEKEYEELKADVKQQNI